MVALCTIKLTFWRNLQPEIRNKENKIKEHYNENNKEREILNKIKEYIMMRIT